MTECAFCGQDMYERVDVGVGVPAPVAVICCELAIDLDYAQRHEQDFVNVERSDLERVQSTLVELRSADEAQPLPPVEERVPSGSGKTWLVYSREHNAWWRPNACGYTAHMADAGRYTHAEALEHCRSGEHPRDFGPAEFMVPAPESAPGEAPSPSPSAERVEKLEDRLRRLCKAIKRHDLRGGHWPEIQQGALLAEALLETEGK